MVTASEAFLNALIAMKRFAQAFVHFPSNLRIPCIYITARKYATKDTASPLLDKIAQDLRTIRKVRDWKALDNEVGKTQEILKDEKIWEKHDILQVSSLLRKKNALENKFSQYLRFQEKYKELKEMLELATEENDEDFRASLEKDIYVLQKNISTLALKSLMRDEDDLYGAIIQINAGAGGTESCDWVSMLSEMYKKWAITEGYQAMFLEQTPGEMAGYKSCTLEILGEYAHGWLRSESGIHRLVRLSPFDSQSRRHTSFAAVSVLPSVKENDVNNWSEIPGAHLKIESFRSSGAGGQHVNTTDSAIRITHIPSGMSVQCQSGRSQHQNKASAMRMLRAKLYELETRQREAEKVAAYQAQPENAWGSQIRSYILQPYQLVKDTRTGYESRMIQDVFNGHGLRGFLESLIMYQNKVDTTKSE